MAAFTGSKPGRIVFKDNQDKPVRIMGVNMDITERKQQEERHSGERAAVPPACRRDAADRLDRLAGRSVRLPEQPVGRVHRHPGERTARPDVAGAGHPPRRPGADAGLLDERRCEDKGVYDLEYRIRRHDGQYRWFKTRGVPIRDEQGRIVNWFGTCTDIEDQKQVGGGAYARSEAALRPVHAAPAGSGVGEGLAGAVCLRQRRCRDKTLSSLPENDLYGKTDADILSCRRPSRSDSQENARAGRWTSGTGVQVVEILANSEDGIVRSLDRQQVRRFRVEDGRTGVGRRRGNRHYRPREPARAGASGSRPPQGRVPGDVGPRTAQPAGPDPQLAANPQDAEGRCGRRSSGHGT